MMTKNATTAGSGLSLELVSITVIRPVLQLPAPTRSCGMNTVSC